MISGERGGTKRPQPNSRRNSLQEKGVAFHHFISYVLILRVGQTKGPLVGGQRGFQIEELGLWWGWWGSDSKWSLQLSHEWNWEPSPRSPQAVSEPARNIKICIIYNFPLGQTKWSPWSTTSIHFLLSNSGFKTQDHAQLIENVSHWYTLKTVNTNTMGTTRLRTPC